LSEKSYLASILLSSLVPDAMRSSDPRAAPAPDAQGTGGDKLVFEQPMREDYVDNAVKFLSHPKVRGSPVAYRRSFLDKKGLTAQEIDEAFRRVPVRSIYPLLTLFLPFPR
jgi:hypothetical protein